MTRLSIVVPCYNEEESLPPLYEKLDRVSRALEGRYEVECVFVNDGSKDRTAEVLDQAQDRVARAQVRVITHEVNRGLGGALQTGYAGATGQWVASLDCDCTYDPELLPDMMNALDDQTDILTGSEFHPDGQVLGVGRFRLFLSQGMSALYRWVFWSRLYSFSCLMRVYRREVFDHVKIRSNGFLSCTEVLMKAVAAGFRVKEFPLTLTTRQRGESSIPIVRTMFEHVWFILKLRVAMWFTPRRRVDPEPRPVSLPAAAPAGAVHAVDAV